MGAPRFDGWLVFPSVDPRDGQDLIAFNGATVGSLLWLRELRHPALSRGRITDGLNAGVMRSAEQRTVWTHSLLDPADDRVAAIFHNGVELGELRWWSSYWGTFPHPTDGVLYGLNMLTGRHHPFACEPMPLTRPHLRVVR